MKAFSFVHAADLHLDSPFQGISRLPDGQCLRRALREATFQAFESVVDLCIDRDVDFLLIAGDVYDGSDRNLRAQLRFRDGLRRLSEAGIPSWVVHGNHDPLDGWIDSIEMPELVHVFGSDVDSVTVVKEGSAVARIHGASFPSKRVGARFARDFQRTGNEPFQIGLLHCNVGAEPDDPYVPRTVEELEAVGLDYWALGHVHERARIRHSDPFIGYPGNLQGRHRGEPGARGVFYVEVDSDGQMIEVPEFVECDAVRWLEATVDISALTTVDDLLARIEEEFDSLAGQGGGRPVVAKLVIRGRGPLHQGLRRGMRHDDLEIEIREMGREREPFIWIEALELATRPEVDIERRREADDFLGDLLKLLHGARESDSDLERLGTDLEELYGHRLARRYLETPSRADLLSLLAEAEARCLDLLQVGEQ